MKYKKITKTLALTLGILSLPVISSNVNIDSNHIGLTIANAAEIIGTYTDSQGITYNLYDNNTASLKDGSYINREWVAGSSPVTSNIVIPETIQNGGTTYTVTRIGEFAFYEAAITSVEIPNTVIEIGMSAFDHCKLLEEVYMYDSVTTLGINAFRRCEAMKTIRLSDNIETISASSFFGCESLTYLKLPNNCTRLNTGSNDGYFYCKSLMMIEGPKSLVKNKNMTSGSSYERYPYKVYFYDEDEDTCLKAFWCKSGADLSDVVEKPANLGQQFKKWENISNTASVISNIVDNTTFVAEYVPGTVGSQYPKLTAPSVLLSSDKSTNRQNVTMTLH